MTAKPAPPALTILLVEDEAPIRQLLHDILQGAGFTLLTASDGLEALRLSQETPCPIDLLLTDYTLPGGLNGVQIAQHIAQTRPTLKVLFISGVPATELVQHGMLQPHWPFLPKPFTVSELLTKVEEVLSAPAAYSMDKAPLSP